jgi:outer membrane lipoprotein-sorting protein
LKFRFLLILLLLILVGCIRKTHRLPPDQTLLPAKTATRTELFEELETISSQVQSLRGTMAIAVSGGGPRSGVLTEYPDLRGTMVVERPRNIRMQVQIPIVLTTVANMVSDGVHYGVHLPLDNQYLVGDVDAPPSSTNSLKDLRPQQFMAGLFVDIRPHLNDPQVIPTFDEAIDGVHSYYVFTFVRVAGLESRTLEKIWIDRHDLQVGRKQLFAKDGRIEVDARYSNYEPTNGIPFPQVVVLQLPLQDYTVEMNFQKAILNETLPEDAFVLPQPASATVVPVTK